MWSLGVIGGKEFFDDGGYVVEGECLACGQGGVSFKE